MPEAKSRPYTAYVVPHTHWDREWYEPFEVFRARLVDVVDQVLDILSQDPSYRSFTLDGQAIVLEDYLAMRSEKRDLLIRQVQEGRLRIGPWYVLADEFLVSPESLVRNLILGQRICREFGPIMPVGYTPDSFGHISQLPLIARGFALDSIVFERGVGDEGERLRGEFRWVGADGRSEIFAVHLLGTYSAAAALGHRDWELRDAYDRQHAVNQIGTVLYGADDQARDLPIWLRETFERLSDGILRYATDGAVLLLNGSDHLFPQPDLPAILRDLNEAFPEVQFVHADIEDFVTAARKPLEELESYQGEFRGSRYQHVLSGVLSSRVYLKQANERTQTLLERYAEPLAALAWLSGAPYPGRLLWQGWRQLLQNHPHDSICGCSVDPVHEQMMVRFASATQIGRTAVRRALQRLAGPPGIDAVTVFNPLPYPREAVVACTLELPAGGSQDLGVHDDQGLVVASQLNAQQDYAAGQTDRRVDRATVRFLASLPPLGVRSFRLVHGARAAAPTNLRVAQENGAVTIENRQVRLEVGSDGAVTLVHKPTDQRYPLHLRFEDEADAGDEYDFSPVVGDEACSVSTPSSGPVMVESGPVAASVRLTYACALPERLNRDRSSREGSVSVPIELELSLDATAAFVRATVTVDNRAEDHRLRLRVGSGCHADHAWADGHFDVLRRPVEGATGDGWYQEPQATSHQRRFVAVSDGDRGLAIFNHGLPEYEAIPGEAGVDVAITLLRCVGWLSREDLRTRPQAAGPSLSTPGAQCPGHHTFELAFLPFAGAWDEGDTFEQAQRFDAAPEVWPAAEVSAARSWMALTAPLELTALKRAENRESLIARIFNPATHPVHGELSLWEAPRDVFEVSLGEERERHLEAPGAELPLTLTPKQVLTLEIVPAKRNGGSEEPASGGPQD